MSCEVLFIYPPLELGKKPKFGFPPLGILYLASFLEQKRINVKVIDCEIKGYSINNILETIKIEKPSMICISVMTTQVLSGLEIANAIKEKVKTPIVFGGAHISSTVDELFMFTDAIDFLVYQEGELTLYDLYLALKEGGNFNEINGLIYKKNGEIIKNPLRERINDLDTLPFPNLDLIDIADYDSYYAKSLPLTSMMASRGCPFNCTFCDQYATHGRKLRLRSVNNIVDEIEINYKKFGIKQIVFKDSTFTVNKKWVKNFCDEIKKRNLKLNWTCNTRVDCIDEDVLKDLKSAGCYMILFGIESSSQIVLDNINKHITIAQIEKGIKLCKQFKIKTTGYFMVGNPGDTKEICLETVKFAKSLNLDYATFGIVVAYPNTQLFNWAIKENVLTDKVWYMKKGTNVSKGTRTIVGNMNLKDFSIDEQIEVVNKANKSFYLNPKYIFKKIISINNFTEFKRLLKSAKEILLN